LFNILEKKVRQNWEHLYDSRRCCPKGIGQKSWWNANNADNVTHAANFIL